MSETPANPNPSPAPPASPAPSGGSRWTSLAIAVAVVTVGGFILGRASGTSGSSDPAGNALPGRVHPPNLHVPLNVAPMTPRVSPEVMARIREAQRQGRTNPTPDPVGQPAPAAAMQAAGDVPAPIAPNLPVFRQVIVALQPQVQTCFAQGASHPGQMIVAAQLHRDAEAGTLQQARVARSTLESQQAEACVLQAVQNAKLPELKGQGDLPMMLPFAYAGPGR